tara:strand:- start:211 stop:639 length:429 start_codon:yes stop_codon:yes gene_type:complete
MKKLLLFILACSVSLASFSQDTDYKWLVSADTGASYLSSDAVDVGNITVGALYSVTDDLMLGGSLGLNFGDAEGETIFIGGRYYFGDIFAAVSYDLGDTDTGANIGLGYGWDVADNVEFAPQLSYNSELESMTLAIGFAIRF